MRKLVELIRIRKALFKIKTYFLPENLKKFFRNKTSKKLESRESEWERKQEREKDRERETEGTSEWEGGRERERDRERDREIWKVPLLNEK